MNLFGVGGVRLRGVTQAAAGTLSTCMLQGVPQVCARRHTHLYALDAEVEVDAGKRLDGWCRSLQAEGRPQRHLARPAVVCQPSAAVVTGKTLAAAIHAGSRGAARRPVYGEGNITYSSAPCRESC